MSRPTFPPHIHKSKILGDKYMIGDEIGRGASGRVYKGLDLENGDFVAIKQISLENICEEDLNVIMQEIDLLKILNHKNIVKYLGSLNTKTDLNIILEYVENGSLDNIIKPSKFGPFPETLAAVYIAQVLEGLVYLHEQGVIHRDIKGANILTTKEGLVKLTDFGVATKLNGSGVNTTFVAGTPYWMAPEVIDLSGSCAASDIWSVGCTVIELLTCFPPYHDLPHYAALYRIVKDEVPPIPANLSPDVRDFLHQCFKKDAKQRPDASTLLLHPWMQNVSRSFQSSVRQTGGTMRSTQPQVSVDSEISIGDDQSNGENPMRERTNRDASNTEPEQEAFGMRSDKDVLSDKNPTSAFDEKSYIRSSSHRLSSTRVDAPSNLTSSHKNSNMVGLDERTLNGEVCTLDLRKEGIIGGECEGEGISALQSKIRRYGTQKDAEFNKLVGSLKPDEPEDVIVSACQKLITFFEEFPDEKIAFVTQHGLLPLMELLQVPKNHVISSVLQIINQIVKENANFQEYACFLGLIPVMMNFAAPKCPQEVRMQAAYFLQQLCESSSSTLQMFIACCGIPVLVGFLEADYIKYREMIHLAIDCMWQVFKLPHSTQRKDFCRIAAMNGILPRLVNTLYSLNEATRFASSSDDGSLPAFGFSPRPQSVPQDPSQPLSKQGKTPLSCSRELGPHEVMPGISDHPLPAGNLERSASHVQLEAAVTSLPELASEGEAGSSITKDSVKNTSQDWKRLGSYKHNSSLAEADLHRQQGVTGRGSSDKPLKQVSNGTPRITNSLSSEQDQVGPFLRLLEKEPPSRHGSGKLEYVRQQSGLMRRESRLPLLQTSMERKSVGELDFLMAEFADVSRQGRESKNLYSNTSFSHKTGNKSFKTARMGSRTSDEGSASRYEVASWTTSGILSGSVILREKAGSMASSGVLSHTAATLDADVAREYLEKVADLLLEFARADATVKYRMCSPSLLTRLFRMVNRIDHSILLKILKCINHLSTDANCLESLQRANAIKHLILYLELHDGPLISQIHNEVLNALFNLCKINKKRMEQAAENGIVPHLMHFINSDSPLKQCALPLLCDMAYASSNSREQLRACGGLDVYLSLLDDDLWSVTALDSLSVCLALDNDQRRVEQELLKKEAVQKLVKFFKCCPEQYFMNILEPFLKIIIKSSRINTTLAVNGLTPLLIARLDHQNAIARINLLKMIKAVYEHHPRPKQLIVENDLPQKLQCLIEERRDGQPSGGQVLVKQLATALLKALHINTVL